MVGAPARQIGWIGEYGDLDLPISGNMETVCKTTAKI